MTKGRYKKGDPRFCIICDSLIDTSRRYPITCSKPCSFRYRKIIIHVLSHYRSKLKSIPVIKNKLKRILITLQEIEDI